jgi:hypothetical protein
MVPSEPFNSPKVPQGTIMKALPEVEAQQSLLPIGKLKPANHDRQTFGLLEGRPRPIAAGTFSCLFEAAIDQARGAIPLPHRSIR